MFFLSLHQYTFLLIRDFNSSYIEFAKTSRCKLSRSKCEFSKLCNSSSFEFLK